MLNRDSENLFLQLLPKEVLLEASEEQQLQAIAEDLSANCSTARPILKAITDLYYFLQAILNKRNLLTSANLNQYASYFKQKIVELQPDHLSTLAQEMANIRDVSHDLEQELTQSIQKDLQGAPENIVSSYTHALSSAIQEKVNTLQDAWSLFTSGMTPSSAQSGNIQDVAKNILKNDPVIKNAVIFPKYGIAFKKNPAIGNSLSKLADDLSNLEPDAFQSLNKLNESLEDFWFYFSIEYPDLAPNSEEERNIALSAFFAEMTNAGTFPTIAWNDDANSPPNIDWDTPTKLQKLVIISESLCKLMQGFGFGDLNFPQNDQSGLPSQIQNLSAKTLSRLQHLIRIVHPNHSLYAETLDLAVSQLAHRAAPRTVLTFFRDNNELKRFIFEEQKITTLNAMHFNEDPKSMEELDRLATQNKNYMRDDLTQAAWKHQLEIAKYTPTTQEKILLNEVVGLANLDLTNIVPATYQAAINEIQTEIDKRDAIPYPHRLSPFVPTRTAHLKAAIQYLQYYLQKEGMVNLPEVRLGAYTSDPGKHRSQYKNGWNLRNEFKEVTEALSYLFPSNRALKSLSEILESKAAKADELKEKHTRHKATFKKRARGKAAEQKYQEKKVMLKKQQNGKAHSDLIATQGFFETPRLNSRKLLLPSFIANHPSASLQANEKTFNDLVHYYSLYNKAVTMLDALGQEGKDLTQSASLNQAIALGEIANFLEKQSILPDDHKDISQLLLVKSLLNQAMTPLANKATTFTLVEATQLTYQGLLQATETTKRICKLADKFNPEEKDSLNLMGRQIVKAKAANHNLQQRAIGFVRNIEALIQSKQEIKEHLSEIFDSNNHDTSLSLGKLIILIENHSSFLSDDPEELLEWSGEYISELKQNELLSTLKKIQQQIGDRVSSGPQILENEILLIDQQVNDLKSFISTQKSEIAKLSAASTEAIQAFSYMANHRTAHLAPT